MQGSLSVRSPPSTCRSAVRSPTSPFRHHRKTPIPPEIRRTRSQEVPVCRREWIDELRDPRSRSGTPPVQSERTPLVQTVTGDGVGCLRRERSRTAGFERGDRERYSATRPRDENAHGRGRFWRGWSRRRKTDPHTPRPECIAQSGGAPVQLKRGFDGWRRSQRPSRNTVYSRKTGDRAGSGVDRRAVTSGIVSNGAGRMPHSSFCRRRMHLVGYSIQSIIKPRGSGKYDIESMKPTRTE